MTRSVTKQRRCCRDYHGNISVAKSYFGKDRSLVSSMCVANQDGYEIVGAMWFPDL